MRLEKEQEEARKEKVINMLRKLISEHAFLLFSLDIPPFKEAPPKMLKETLNLPSKVSHICPLAQIFFYK